MQNTFTFYFYSFAYLKNILHCSSDVIPLFLNVLFVRSLRYPSLKMCAASPAQWWQMEFSLWCSHRWKMTFKKSAATCLSPQTVSPLPVHDLHKSLTACPIRRRCSIKNIKTSRSCIIPKKILPPHWDANCYKEHWSRPILYVGLPTLYIS